MGGDQGASPISGSFLWQVSHLPCTAACPRCFAWEKWSRGSPAYAFGAVLSSWHSLHFSVVGRCRSVSVVAFSIPAWQSLQSIP